MEKQELPACPVETTLTLISDKMEGPYFTRSSSWY